MCHTCIVSKLWLRVVCGLSSFFRFSHWFFLNMFWVPFSNHKSQQPTINWSIHLIHIESLAVFWSPFKSWDLSSEMILCWGYPYWDTTLVSCSLLKLSFFAFECSVLPHPDNNLLQSKPSNLIPFEVKKNPLGLEGLALFTDSATKILQTIGPWILNEKCLIP